MKNENEKDEVDLIKNYQINKISDNITKLFCSITILNNQKNLNSRMIQYMLQIITQQIQTLEEKQKTIQAWTKTDIIKYNFILLVIQIVVFILNFIAIKMPTLL